MERHPRNGHSKSVGAQKVTYCESILREMDAVNKNLVSENDEMRKTESRISENKSKIEKLKSSVQVEHEELMAIENKIRLLNNRRNRTIQIIQELNSAIQNETKISEREMHTKHKISQNIDTLLHRVSLLGNQLSSEIKRNYPNTKTQKKEFDVLSTQTARYAQIQDDFLVDYGDEREDHMYN